MSDINTFVAFQIVNSNIFCFLPLGGAADRAGVRVGDKIVKVCYCI